LKTKYFDLIDQSFDWPQEEFQLSEGELAFHGIPMMQLVEEFGTPLRITYLPIIGKNIGRAKGWFKAAADKVGFEGDYHYCYVTKSNHFHHVTKEVLKHGALIETSSAYDLDIVDHLVQSGDMRKESRVICNGFKTDNYMARMLELRDAGLEGLTPVIDNLDEWKRLSANATRPMDIGIRIATEEEPKFAFYTSRLGLGYNRIAPLYKEAIKDHPLLTLRMLHFFVNTGIRDTAYYWNELNKALDLYVALRQICPTLTALNIGGGLPTKNSLAFEYDYAYMFEAILEQVAMRCNAAGVPHPDIFTEFGSFTVGASGATLFKVLHQKRQNDRERWNMIDSSFMTTLPDSWAVNHRFLMLPLNRWMDPYERVFLGGLTCDSDDYYNSEQHLNAIYLPTFKENDPIYLGFFHTGAYQDNIGGHGGVHHCLMPGLRHILIDDTNEGGFECREFCPAQPSEQVLSLLGYAAPAAQTERP